MFAAARHGRKEKEISQPPAGKEKRQKNRAQEEDRAGQTANQQTHGGSGLKAALHPNARLD